MWHFWHNSNDFALCFLCHSEAPFADTSGNARSDTNFREHGFHMGRLQWRGSGGTDIDVAGAGQGNSLCAECHYRTHSTQSAYQTSNNTYKRLVNFAPNVRPRGGVAGNPLTWTFTAGSPATGTCTLMCHGADHTPKGY